MKKSVFSIFSVLMVLMLLVGCTSTPDTKAPAPDAAAPAASEQVVRIAHLVPLTGSASSYGNFITNSAKMAADEINAAGGVKLPDGTMAKIEYIAVDETSNSADAIDAAKNAISKDPIAMLGPNRSGGVFAAEPLWKEAKIPTITDGTAAGTTQLDNPYTFRMQISSEYWIPLLVKTAAEIYNVKRPAVIYGLNDYSKANWDATLAAMEKFDMKPVTVQTFNDGDQDFSAQLIEIKNNDPDAIFIYAYTPEVGKITRQRSELGMGDVPVFSERAAGVPSVIDLAGPTNFNGMVTTTTLSTGDAEYADFINKYESTFKETISPSHVNHYDSVYIIADIVSRVGLDREKIREELSKLDYQGVLGHYVADKEGNLVHWMYTQVYKDGKWEVLQFEEYPVDK
ncbi:MAG: ABC transporter substrate-binding protein [Anaerolineaceae bacterium]|jgi:branched-chain amino acid transport system substrate-binding protein